MRAMIIKTAEEKRVYAKYLKDTNREGLHVLKTVSGTFGPIAAIKIPFDLKLFNKLEQSK